MKHTTVLLLVLTATTVAFALKKDPAYREARLKGALAKMQLRIADDGGNAVADANVAVFMGMNFRDQGYWIRGRTDTNGVFNVAGKTCGDAIEIYLSKEGYYDSVKTFRFAAMGAEREVKDGKWQPFGEREEIILRESDVHAARLIALDRIVDVVHTNVWLGFDMEKMDFVKPVGIGTSVDWEINVDWDGLPAWDSKRCSAEIRFPAALTGGYYSKNVMDSRFPFPFSATTDAAYGERRVRIVDRNGDPHTTNIAFPKDESFVTRTRCIIDEKQTIKSANYGCIRRLEIGPSRRGVALLRLSYVFNPTPNDTSLEPKR